jgi:hypothetical protein
MRILLLLSLLLMPLASRADDETAGQHIKKAAHETKEAAKEGGKKVKKGAKKAGHATKDAAKEVGHGFRDAFKKAKDDLKN